MMVAEMMIKSIFPGRRVLQKAGIHTLMYRWSRNRIFENADPRQLVGSETRIAKDDPDYPLTQPNQHLVRVSIRVALVFFCLTLGACSSQTGPSDVGLNVKPPIQDLIAAFSVAEKVRPLGADNIIPNDSPQLCKGWSGFNQANHFRWAIGQKSSIAFSTPEKNDIELILSCFPFVPDSTHHQALTILLNNTVVKEIELENKPGRFQIKLPSQVVKLGPNWIQFKYRYAERPADYGNTRDIRRLAVAFSEIRLKSVPAPREKILLQHKNAAIRQSEQTLLVYHYRIPKNCSLAVRIDPPVGNLLAQATLQTTDGPARSFRFDADQRKLIPLNTYAGRIVRLCFSVSRDTSRQVAAVVEGADLNSIIWREIALVKNKEADRGRRLQADNSELKRFQQQIQGLDVIYLIFDAFNADHSSLYGYSRPTTPFLERLGAKSVVWDHFFANHPYTLASTGTLLTSTYAYEHGCIDDKSRLSPIIPDLPEMLAEHQIDSYLITEHHYLNGPWGLNRGFKKVYFNNNYTHGHLDQLTRALDEIYAGKDGARRKFIYLHLIPPHEPYDPPNAYQMFNEPAHQLIGTDADTLNKIQNGQIKVSQAQMDHIVAMYDGYVRYADSIAEDILKHLTQLGVRQKAVVFIASDHGEAFMQHGFTSHCSTVYDEMVHIPFIMALPDKVQWAAGRVAALASVVDVTPTVLDIFGLTPPDGLEGASILPRLFGAREPDPIYLGTLLTHHHGIRDRHYKLIRTPHSIELYDLKSDPAEKHNLATREEIRTEYYLQLLRGYAYDTRNRTGGKVDLKALDAETVNKLKELGYIK